VNPYEHLSVIVDRIGFIGGANRAREADIRRIELNGGPPPLVEVRLEAVTRRLETLADELEARLA
jgi:hypothetical protein